MLWYQQLLALCLTLLVVCLPPEALADAFRCYSCTWNAYPEDGFPGPQPCRSADDIRVIPSDSNNFISDPECIRCMKSEIWSGGELQSVMRACVRPDSKMYSYELGCEKEDTRQSQTLVACMCDGDLCNRAGNFSRRNLWTYIIIASLFVWLQRVLR